MENNSVGIVLLEDEDPQDTMSKWFIWVGAMLLFVIVLVWVTRSYKPEECAFDHRYDSRIRDRRYGIIVV